jgi:gluconolactonase
MIYFYRVMKYKIIWNLLFFISSVACSAQELSDTIPLIKKGARPVKLSDQFLFTEGPAADKMGNVYFTDQPNNRIMRWLAKDGKLEEWLKPSGRSNGLYFDPEGNLWACADEKNEIWKISPQKIHTIEVANFNGKRFNGPNDLWIHPNGNIYFTDPYYKRDYWQHTDQEIPKQQVYLWNKKTNLLEIVDSMLMQPNGIIGSSDGKYLFVADIRDRKTYRYSILPNGSLTNKVLFCPMGSDGMTLDRKGNLYLTGRGVTIFNPSGKQIGNIPIAEPWTANVTFGGKNRKSLFITASKSVYTLAMNVKGN